MEIQNQEWTVEEVLSMHRYWITKLYVEDKRTEEEIVGILYERRVVVTLAQIRRCVEDWNLVSLLASNSGSSATPRTAPDEVVEGLETIPSPEPSPPPRHASYIPNDAEIIQMYTQKPLPSLHAKASTSSTTRDSNLNSKPDESGPVSKLSPDRLRFTCHHGPGPSEVHEVETTLDFIESGPSQLEIYADDEQGHEMVALGIPRKAGQKRPGNAGWRNNALVPRKRARYERLDDASGHDPEGRGKGKEKERARYERLGDASGHDPEGRGKGKGKEKEKERDSSPTPSSGSHCESV